MDITTKRICVSRYVATELATDLVVNVGDVKFYLHKVYLTYDLELITIVFSGLIY